MIARPHNNYGPRAHAIGISEELIPKLILAALAGTSLDIYGDGKQTRDFTYVGETARYLYELSQSDGCLGEVFNVCKGEEVSVLEVVRNILHLTESSSAVRHLPARKNDVLRLWGDNAKLRKYLGHAPNITLLEGLRTTVQWYRANRVDQSHDLRTRDAGTWPYEDWIPRS